MTEDAPQRDGDDRMLNGMRDSLSSLFERMLGAAGLEPAEEVAIEDLVANPDEYDGTTVQTEGFIEYHDTEQVVEDGDPAFVQTGRLYPTGRDDDPVYVTVIADDELAEAVDEAPAAVDTAPFEVTGNIKQLYEQDVTHENQYVLRINDAEYIEQGEMEQGQIMVEGELEARPGYEMDSGPVEIEVTEEDYRE